MWRVGPHLPASAGTGKLCALQACSGGSAALCSLLAGQWLASQASCFELVCCCKPLLPLPPAVVCCIDALLAHAGARNKLYVRCVYVCMSMTEQSPICRLSFC
jgi:hypothetical protein